ncbi:MAG: glycosyltransferase [Anaerolineales bacterium]|nr:glycosyltransferase [Anaerolineales bacterium]
MTDSAPNAAPLRVGMVMEELADAGGIEEALVTLAEALRPLGVTSVVLSCQPIARDNQYARRLRAAGVPLASLPRWCTAARDQEAQLGRWAASVILIAVGPLTLLALAGLRLFRRRGVAAGWGSLRGALQKRLPVRGWLRLAWAAAVRGWARRARLDLLHVHGYGGGASPAGALAAAAAAGLPLVYSEHGIPWPSLRAEAGLHAQLAQADRLMAVSHAAARALRELCAARQPIEVIYHVVADAPATARPAPNGQLVFGCAAMLRPPKGHRYWLDSLPSVLAALPDSRFVLAGDGSERAALEKQAAALGVAGQVTFAGQAPNAALRRMMGAEWSVFVLPSIEEPLGVVVVEAMAAGLPIIATRAGGVLDLVRDEETALLVPPGDSAALAAAQIRLARDPALRQRLGAAARAAYLQGGFSPAAIGQATLNVYRAAHAARAPRAV